MLQGDRLSSRHNIFIPTTLIIWRILLFVTKSSLPYSAHYNFQSEKSVPLSVGASQCAIHNGTSHFPENGQSLAGHGHSWVCLQSAQCTERSLTHIPLTKLATYIKKKKKKKKRTNLVYVSVERVHGRVVPIMASAARTAKLDTEWLVIMKGTMVTWVVMNYHWIPRAFFLAITVSIPVPGNFLKLICKQPLNWCSFYCSQYWW